MAHTQELKWLQLIYSFSVCTAITSIKWLFSLHSRLVILCILANNNFFLLFIHYMPAVICLLLTYWRKKSTIAMNACGCVCEMSVFTECASIWCVCADSSSLSVLVWYTDRNLKILYTQSRRICYFCTAVGAVICCCCSFFYYSFSKFISVAAFFSSLLLYWM